MIIYLLVRSYSQVKAAAPPHSVTLADTIRQKFTLKERDNETGLDYFLARYYASTQGRFSCADPLLSSGKEEEPQTWNRYSYALNNPLAFIDPSGLYVLKFKAGLAQAQANLQQIAKTYGTNSNEYKKAERALNVYGAEGVKNGVTIFTKQNLGVAGFTQVEGVAGRKTADNPTGQNIHITFDKASLDAPTLQDNIAHEGSHGADGSDWVKSGFSNSANPRAYQLEVDGYIISSLLAEAAAPSRSSSARLPYFKEPGKNPYLPERVPYFKPEWAGADRARLTAFRGNIDNILSRPKRAGGYDLTPASTERAFVKGSRFPR